jgi:adenine-specific DNA-methyltransferase
VVPEFSALQFDVGRAGIERFIDDALASGDEATMRGALEELRRLSQPYLNWTGKAERGSFAVDTVPLHVHERIDPASLLNAVRKRMKGEAKDGKAGSPMMQMGLFSAAFENLPLRDAIDNQKVSLQTASFRPTECSTALSEVDVFAVPL